MIEIQTVLILGAGSSKELNFPLGRQLINEVYSLVKGETGGARLRGVGDVMANYHLKNSHLLVSLLNMIGEKKTDGFSYSIDDIDKFADDLWDSKLVSIDEFLYHRKEYSLLAKICIFLVLSKYENEKIFNPSEQSDKWTYPGWGWYEYF